LTIDLDPTFTERNFLIFKVSFRFLEEIDNKLGETRILVDKEGKVRLSRGEAFFVGSRFA